MTPQARQILTSMGYTPTNTPQDFADIWDPGTEVDVQFVTNTDQNIYPLAEYGWDGGSPIGTFTWNLTNGLTFEVLSGGLTSTLVSRTDTTIPGYALYQYHDNNPVYTLVVFN